MEFLQGKRKAIPGLKLDEKQVKNVHKQWKLREDNEQALLRDLFPRFELSAEQIAAILDAERSAHGIYSTLEEIAENPYILAEEYTGDGPDDHISFNRIDHGVFPSPDLGGEPLAEKDDGRRLGAACQHGQAHGVSRTAVLMCMAWATRPSSNENGWGWFARCNAQAA